jgi:hypothetical protein
MTILRAPVSVLLSHAVTVVTFPNAALRQALLVLLNPLLPSWPRPSFPTFYPAFISPRFPHHFTSISTFGLFLPFSPFSFKCYQFLVLLSLLLYFLLFYVGFRCLRLSYTSQ